MVSVAKCLEQHSPSNLPGRCEAGSKGWHAVKSRHSPRIKMNDQSLHLAVIGNGRTAALLDSHARLLWWCFPRFDSDPVFCRLLSGSEEKGFSDVILDRCASEQSEYL